jgi:hypothetical protein
LKPPKTTTTAATDVVSESERAVVALTESERVVALRAAAAKLRKLEPSKLHTLSVWTPLSQVPIGSVLLVSGCEVKNTSYGLMALLQCTLLDKGTADGNKEVQVIAPERYGDSAQYPALMVYLGKSAGKKSGGGGGSAESTNSPAHRLIRCGGLGDKYISQEEMRSAGEALTLLSTEALNDLLRIKNLGDFAPNTLIMYSGARRQTFGKSEELWVVNYEYHLDDSLRSGEVIFPACYGDKLSANPSGLALYRGKRVAATSGREYHDLEIISQEEADNWVGRLCDQQWLYHALIYRLTSAFFCFHTDTPPPLLLIV